MNREESYRLAFEELDNATVEWQRKSSKASAKKALQLANNAIAYLCIYLGETNVITD